MNINNYYVYIMSNKSNTTIYVGVTNNLIRRVYEHKNHLVDGFTSKYNVDKLVYFEQVNDIEAAITREKQLKKWNRKKKEILVDTVNKERIDLYNSII